jgi:hypothetical protein
METIVFGYILPEPARVGREREPVRGIARGRE